ncbi:hypothetical protein EON83_27815 [bacterium]|nr:MAG: hypothetical protein EON83_27815 [bacterium]
MPFLTDFPSPAVAREAYAFGSGFSEKGTPLLTLEALDSYSKGRGARRERIYQCPFCGGTEKAFHVNVETGAFNCKRSSCGVKGCLREFWKESTQVTFQGRGKARGRIPSAFRLSPEATFQPTEGGNWRELWRKSFDLNTPEGKPGRDYLAGRGIVVEVAQRAGVRFSRNWAPSADGDKYTGGAAVLFPLTNRAGELVAVGSRYLNPWTSPEGDTIKARVGGDKQEGIFRAPVADGLDPLQEKQPVLVEGPIDALALASCGVPTIAANGVSFPEWFAPAMSFKSPFLAPDGDEGGAKAMKSWRRDVGPFAPSLRCLNIADGLGVKDFGAVIEAKGADALTEWLKGEGVIPVVNNGKTTGSNGEEGPKSWRDRDAAYWERVRESVSPGAVAICQTLHAFSFLFDRLHRGELPEGDVVAIIDDESILFEDVPGVLRAIEIDWTERATSCNATQRALSEAEAAALNRAHQLLEWLSASYSPEGWLDLNTVVDDGIGEAEQRAQQHKVVRRTA